MDEKKYFSKVKDKLVADIKEYYILVLCLAGYVLLAFILNKSICPVRLVIGVPCPGCGVTRSLIELLHGHFLIAWQLHPFIYLLIGSAIVFVILRYFTDCNMKWFETYLTVIGAFMILYYIYRMIRFFPVHEPMTYNEQSLLQLLINAIRNGC